MLKCKLNGLKIKNLDDFHISLSNQLHFPEYYGKNLDALWDCLVELSTCQEISITWTNFDISIESLGQDLFDVLKVFLEYKKVNKNFTVNLHF